MDTVIGLGKAGCAIADQFSKFDQYRVYKVDVGLEGLKKDGIYNMPKQSGPEMYEQNCPNLKNFFKDVRGEVLFIVGGSGDITGATLRILEKLSNCDINILYIRPDVNLLPETKKRHEWVTFNVLQEYARSAVFKRLWLIDNVYVEKIIGDVPIKSYYDTINQFIVSTIHMVNVYNHIESVANTFSEPFETHRISTIGLAALEKSEINLFFPLDNVKDIRYYYAINNQRIEEDGKLFTKIKEQVKNQTTDEIKTSFGVYSTDYDSDYVYVVCNTPVIQRHLSNEEKPLDLFA